MKKDKKYIEKYGSFYHSKDWRNCRRIKMANNPLCEECLKKGKLVEAEEVHHIIPIDTKQGWELRLNLDNLESLCTECHNEKHKSRQSAMSQFDRFWDSLQDSKKETKGEK